MTGWDYALASLTAAGASVQAAVAIVMARGLKHSERSARAATKALELAERTSQMQLRAYVGVTRTEFSGFESGQPILANFDLTNTGQTPAINLRCFVSFYYVPPEEVSALPRLNPDLGDATTVGAGVSIYPWRREFPGEWEPKFADLAAGRLVLIVQGAFAYEDLFDNPHHGAFRFRAYDPANFAKPGKLTYEKTGNHSD